jgi:hypothetical protein
MIESDEGRRIDHLVWMVVGVPVDLGWGIAVLNADQTVTRTCRSCGVSVVTAVLPGGKVAEAAVHHRSNCRVVDRLGNNPTRS